MNKINGAITAVVLLVTMGGAVANSPTAEKVEPAQAAVVPEAKDAKTMNKECEAPSWAKAIGHEEKWKLHNGCKGQ